MPRAIWKGSISFGLVTIPVEVHTGVRDHRPRFRLLHADDRSPVKFERVCQREGRAVAWEDLVKGYEYEKGRFVVLTKEDFKAAALEKHKRIDILDFVKADEIDDRYFDTAYYILPGSGGERAYALLREALRQTGWIGVAKIILRDAQHLAAVEVIEQALVLTMMRYADELVDIGKFSFPPAGTVKKAELDMAKALVEGLAGKWQPEKYTDDYRDNLMRVIKARMKGVQPRLKDTGEPVRGEVVDLMERLRKSLEATGKAGTQTRKRTTKRPTRVRRARRAA
jgi:DNA end-binding protein Ku